MKKLLIRNGSLLSPIDGFNQVIKDIYLEEGLICEIGDSLEKNCDCVDASGCLVTPGLIDIHTHCFPHPSARIGLDPDVLGIQRGATTILDAGTSGAYNYAEFKKIMASAKTRVFTLLNVSKEGLLVPHELDDLNKIDEAALIQVVNENRDNIVGLKARASASVVGQMGLTPIEMAAGIAQKVSLPLMVHVGNYPPALKEVLNLLNQNDICTHAYHGKQAGILTEEGHVIEEAIAARKRGVLFDVGHGVASFSFKVFKQALAEGFDTDLISTDLHVENYQGPVYNLAAVLTKMLNCGESLENVISKTTSQPAMLYKLEKLGQLKTGYFGDISILKLQDCSKVVVDSIGDELECTRELELVATIISRGEQSEVFRHTA